MTRFRCRWLVTMEGEPLENAAFVVEKNRFVEVGPASELLERPGEFVDLGESVVLPGLINAHCHLDYSSFRGSILPSRNFPRWISRINALKRSLNDDDYLKAVELGFDELQRSGVTSVFDIVATPQILPRLAPPRIRTWFFLELIDIRPRPWIDENAFGSWLCFEPSDWLGGFGLSPHAPYTASAELYSAALTATQNFKMPLTTHVSESASEYEMFAAGKGDLFDFLSKMGRPMTDCGRLSPFRSLALSGLLPKDALLVHMNELDEADLEILDRDEWRSLSIVHCPKSNRFLHHRPFPMEALRERGFNLCLGTDSLASNDSLNLFSEMRMAARNHSFVSPKELVEMVTVKPAHAIGLEESLGQIKPGYLADAISIPFRGGYRSIYEEIINYRDDVLWMMVDGKLVA
ncbi:MAG TPA: amidohydrolase family protein [Chthoniobacterales bacterium]|nr:amidohydrolase family protein [Chthoniobacterales bacterium]